MARASTVPTQNGIRPNSTDEREAIEAAWRERRRNRRESIESFVVVVVGFLVWSFEAEGFMIPTGSMAPTLMGRHKEVVCPECGWTYRINADSEVESGGTGAKTNLRVAWGVCENCRFSARVDDEPSFAGDRVYTLKADSAVPIDSMSGGRDPRRWDVTVFKLPEDPTVRYIKRLVGMPGEVLRIHHGDLWRSEDQEGAPFEILRRPPAQSLQVNVPVYDDSYRSHSVGSDPRWRRWTPSAGWREATPGSYRATPEGDAWEELRYRHVVPSPEQAEAITLGKALPFPPRPTLITDFCSYNTELAPQKLSEARSVTKPWFQPHWVGDLALSLQLNVEEPEGRVRLTLIEAGISHDCQIDLTTGVATLSRAGEALGAAAPTSIKAAGSYQLTFANIDDRLTLWVDGSLPFGQGLAYESGGSARHPKPTAEDLEPARVAAAGGAVSVDRLVLKRDIYYTQSPSEPDSDDLLDYRIRPPAELFSLLADPARYASLRWRESREFPIAEGRYMMLGDNSSWSRDGRAWTRVDQTSPYAPERGWDSSGRESWEVPRELVIGRAFCVYWPHFQPVWPRLKLSRDVVLPARPNVEELRWIY